MKLASAKASFEQTLYAEAHPDKRWSAASALTPDTFGWAVLPEVGKPQELIATLAEPLALADGESLQVVLTQNHGTEHTLGKFRLTATASAETGELASLKAELAEAQKARTELEASVAKCLVTVQNAAPRTVRILPRGNFLDESGETVTPATPAFLSSLPPPATRGYRGAEQGWLAERKSFGGQLSRLDLANWIVSRENPLTARAVMNRTWKQFFGSGISRVLDDLGAQGEPPTNPALLDWLACEFQDSGWDVKRMVRVMVTSATYKQVSTVSKALQAADPYNREYARQSRFRLEAEEVRDNALFVAGLLSPKLGGPSVKPYQPERYWENLNFPVRDWMADKGENQYRRGLYTWWGSGASCIRRCSRSTRPAARSARPSATAPTSRNRRWFCSTTRPTWKRRARWPWGSGRRAAALPRRKSGGRFARRSSVSRVRIGANYSGRCLCRAARPLPPASERSQRFAPAPPRLQNEARRSGRARRLDARRAGAPQPPRNDHPPMNLNDELSQFRAQQLTRRALLGRATQGLGALALASLESGAHAQNPGGAWRGAAGKAKRVIWLSMAGGPSHLETFDPKPKLGQMHGQPMPESFTKGQQLAQLQGQKLTCYGPQLPFAKFGKSQIEICGLFPKIGSVIDDICFLRSMTTDAINHDPAHMFMNTGSQIAGRPSMGSWLTYGLGTEAKDLPGFVVLTSLGRGGQNQPIAARQWSSGFLPSKYQGVPLRSKGDPVLYLTSPGGVSRESQGADVKAINTLNREHNSLVDDPEIATRIAQYEMAFQLQASVPELMDSVEREERDAGTLRLPAWRRQLRKQLPPRPAARGEGRTVHPALPQGLGSPRRHQERRDAQGRGDRPGVAWP